MTKVLESIFKFMGQRPTTRMTFQRWLGAPSSMLVGELTTKMAYEIATELI